MRGRSDSIHALAETPLLKKVGIIEAPRLIDLLSGGREVAQSEVNGSPEPQVNLKHDGHEQQGIAQADLEPYLKGLMLEHAASPQVSLTPHPHGTPLVKRLQKPFWSQG